MKRTFKILLLTILAVTMVFCAIGCAEPEEEKKGLVYSKAQADTGYTITKFYDDGTETLDLGAIAQENHVKFIRIKKNAFKGNDTIKKIIVPSSVETIDAGAFANMEALEEIVLPFVGAKLNADPSINFSSSAEDKAVDDMRSFGYIFGKTEYDMGKAVTLNYNSTSSNTYYLPLNLNKITINPENDYAIPMYAFYGLKGVATIELEAKVNKIGDYAFANSGIEKMNLPVSVKAINEGAFSNCVNLKNFTFNGSNLETIGNKAFYATKLTKIVLPSSVKTIGDYAFSSQVDASMNITDESMLTEITLSQDLISIGAYAFASCEKLETVNVSGSGILLGNYAFAYCKKLNAENIESYFIYDEAGRAFVGTKILY